MAQGVEHFASTKLSPVPPGKNKKKSKAWWYMPVVPPTQEDEAIS
jgi:hypothetical protein